MGYRWYEGGLLSDEEIAEKQDGFIEGLGYMPTMFVLPFILISTLDKIFDNFLSVKQFVFFLALLIGVLIFLRVRFSIVSYYLRRIDKYTWIGVFIFIAYQIIRFVFLPST